MSFEEYLMEKPVGRGQIEVWIESHMCLPDTCEARGKPFPEDLMEEVLHAVYVTKVARSGVFRYLRDDHRMPFTESAMHGLFRRINGEGSGVPQLAKRAQDLVNDYYTRVDDTTEHEAVSTLVGP